MQQKYCLYYHALERMRDLKAKVFTGTKKNVRGFVCLSGKYHEEFYCCPEMENICRQ